MQSILPRVGDQIANCNAPHPCGNSIPSLRTGGKGLSRFDLAFGDQAAFLGAGFFGSIGVLR